jgi:ribosomal protein S1
MGFMSEQDVLVAAQEDAAPPSLEQQQPEDTQVDTSMPDGQTEETEEADDSGDRTSITDLEAGLEIQGVVKSVTDFGASAALGVGPQGLVHISQLARRRVNQVSDVVKVGDEVTVWVKKVDKKRGRISLTMVKPPTRQLKDVKPDAVVNGVVTRIEPYGVFLDIGTGRDGMIHVSELTEGYIGSPEDVLSVGDKIEAKVINVDRKARKVDLSTKDFIQAPQASAPEPQPVVEEQGEADSPVPTAMELAFEAALERNKQRSGLDKILSKRTKR